MMDRYGRTLTLSAYIVSASLLVSVAGFAPAQAMTGPPTTTTLVLTDAKIAIDNKDFKKAIAELQKALEEKDDDADVWNLMGFSYRQMRELDLAWDAYERALTIDPNHRGANEYLGELYLQQGQLELAKKQLQKLVKVCPFGCRERQVLQDAIKAAES